MVPHVTFNLLETQDFVNTFYGQLFMTHLRTEETVFQDFLVVLKILRKCFLGTPQTVILSASSTTHWCVTRLERVKGLKLISTNFLHNCFCLPESRADLGLISWTWLETVLLHQVI